MAKCVWDVKSHEGMPLIHMFEQPDGFSFHCPVNTGFWCVFQPWGSLTSLFQNICAPWSICVMCHCMCQVYWKTVTENIIYVLIYFESAVLCKFWYICPSLPSSASILKCLGCYEGKRWNAFECQPGVSGEPKIKAGPCIHSGCPFQLAGHKAN